MGSIIDVPGPTFLVVDYVDSDSAPLSLSVGHPHPRPPPPWTVGVLTTIHPCTLPSGLKSKFNLKSIHIGYIDIQQISLYIQPNAYILDIVPNVQCPKKYAAQKLTHSKVSQVPACHSSLTMCNHHTVKSSFLFPFLQHLSTFNFALEVGTGKESCGEATKPGARCQQAQYQPR